MMNLLVTIGKKQHHLSVKPGTPLPEALALLGFPIALPCGGKGSCGKCRVKATGQLSPITPAERRCLSAGELRNGLRLLCQTAVLGEARIELPEESAEIVVEGVSAMPQNRPIDGKALCAALDIGTTTVAARLYVAEELESSPVASAGRRNPQAAFGADVLSRMERAQAGDAPALRGCIIDCLDDLLTELMQMAQARPAQIRELVITGNTAMLYLLTGRDTACLSKAPFLPEHLFGDEITAEALGLHAVKASRVYLPHCASAFIGADCLCAMLAGGMTEAEAPCALLDLGTNGELAVFNGTELWCASTAAGPAFEG
ncbi:MAG: ASKHA domain-containing protein, partial [Acutalibacteraceae bacterium]